MDDAPVSFSGCHNRQFQTHPLKTGQDESNNCMFLSSCTHSQCPFPNLVSPCWWSHRPHGACTANNDPIYCCGRLLSPCNLCYEGGRCRSRPLGFKLEYTLLMLWRGVCPVDCALANTSEGADVGFLHTPGLNLNVLECKLLKTMCCE